VGVWKEVAMDYLKFNPGLECPTLLRPAGKLPHRAATLQPSSTLLDTPRRTPMALPPPKADLPLSRLRSSPIPLFLGAKKRLYKRLRRSVGWLVGPSVPTMQLRGKLFTSRLLREEEEEEENWLRRYSFAPRD
jgi:hypothetical protein